MFHINPILIIIILLCIIVIIGVSYFVNIRFKEKQTQDKYSKRNKRICIIFAILTLVLMFTVTNYISNRTLYQLKSELQNKYDNVSNIDVSGSQPHCYINIYVDEEECEFEDIEPIFISMMKEIQNKEIYEYIQKKQSKNPDFQLVFLHICFYTSEKRGAKSVFQFSSFKDFKEWELDGDSSKKYNVLDYMDN